MRSQNNSRGHERTNADLATVKQSSHVVKTILANRAMTFRNPDDGIETQCGI
jgi:hypothetical protein